MAQDGGNTYLPMYDGNGNVHGARTAPIWARSSPSARWSDGCAGKSARPPSCSMNLMKELKPDPLLYAYVPWKTRPQRSLQSLLKWCIVWALLLRTVSAESTNGVITLETFVVEARRINPHPWQYIAVPGYEILSQCDADQTEAVARHVANSLEEDRRLMPSGSWGELTVPLTFIMFDFKPANSIAPFVPKPLESKEASGHFGTVVVREDRVNDVIFYLGQGDGKDGGVDTGDSDTHCVVQNRWNSPWNWSGGATGRGPIPMGRLFRLNSAVPAMPAWFEYGLVGPCGVLRMLPVRDPESQKFRGTVVAAARWLTVEENTSLVTNYKKKNKIPVLPPIRDLFHPDHRSKQSSLSDWPSPEYMAEASLFVRWGMTPVAEEVGNQHWSSSEARRLNEAHRKAFDRFLDRSRTEPVTESVFRECFGFGYAEMQSVLSEYLVTTAQAPFILNPQAMQGWSPDDPVASIREATADEIGRIVGDWLRMQAASLPGSRSAEREAYLRAAGHVLERAFRDDNDLSSSVRLLPPKDAQHEPREHASQNTEAGEKSVVISPSKIHDPRLLAVYGLYYFDIGDSTSARVLLEATIQAKTPRPAAYVALAQLNRAAALAKPASDNGKFSPTQVAAILTPLFTVIKNWNLDVGGYLLIADTWSHSAAKPSLANLQVLVQGLHRNPFDSSLYCATAELYAQWGYWEEADEAVERSRAKGVRLRLP